jgi:cytochrome b
MRMPALIRNTWIKAWDPLLRYGHWALVTSFAVAYLSAEEDAGSPDQLNVWCGYVVGAILAIPIIWGFVGTRHARFSDFAFGPAITLRYVADELRGRTRRYLGPSPARPAMIFAPMFVLAGTVRTGWVDYGNAGHWPLASAAGVVSPAQTEENDGAEQAGQGRESAAGKVHGLFANITLGLVVPHVPGVGLSSFRRRENLVMAMFSGRKRGGDGE